VAERTAPAVTGWRNVWIAVGLIALSNLMTNEVLPSWAYVPWNVGMTVLLAWFAVHVDHRHPFDLGIDPRNLGQGLLWGGAIMAVILGGLVAGAVLPWTSDLLRDDRVGDVPFWGMAYQVFLRIPLGTVLLEEMAFRGVLLALLIPRTTLWRAVWWSSALFGLWHVLPAIGIEQTNPVLERLLGDGPGRVVAVIGAVAFTTGAGYVFCFLRLRSGSLLAPVLLHVSTNSLGFLVAWALIRTT
jgi:membrane protease YdiL (CAAX protease family)